MLAATWQQQTSDELRYTAKQQLSAGIAVVKCMAYIAQMCAALLCAALIYSACFLTLQV